MLNNPYAPKRPLDDSDEPQAKRTKLSTAPSASNPYTSSYTSVANPYSHEQQSYAPQQPPQYQPPQHTQRQPGQAPPFQHQQRGPPQPHHQQTQSQFKSNRMNSMSNSASDNSLGSVNSNNSSRHTSQTKNNSATRPVVRSTRAPISIGHNKHLSKSSTPSSSSLSSRVTPRKDLFDENHDVKFKNTQPFSSITAPTLTPPNMFNQWRQRARESLHTFQRTISQSKSKSKSSHSHSNSNSNSNNKTESKEESKEPSDPVLRILGRHTIELDPGSEKVRLIQEEILNLCHPGNLSGRLKRFHVRHNNNSNNNNNFNKTRINGIDKINNSMPRSQRQYFDKHYFKLPGPLPKSVTRDVLDRLIRKEKYFVAEKSDGLRFMLFICKFDKKCYLIDRKFHVYQIIHPFYSKCFPDTYTGLSNGCTLLDGELMLKYDRLNFFGKTDGGTDGNVFDEGNGENQLLPGGYTVDEVTNTPLELKPTGQLLFLAFDCSLVVKKKISIFRIAFLFSIFSFLLGYPCTKELRFCLFFFCFFNFFC